MTDRYTRRKALRAGTVAAAGFFAGCLGDGDEGTDDDETGDDTTASPEPTATRTPPDPTPTATATASADEPVDGGSEEPETKLPVTGEAVPELAAFDEAMVEFMEARDIEAGALGVARDGEVVFERGYGWVDPELTEPLDPDATFRIGSISKFLTEAALVQLLESGELAPDDAVLPLLDVEPPAGEPADERWSEVTVEHLYTHRGGWDIQQLGYDPMYAPVRVAEGLGLDQPPTKYDVTRFMLDQPMQFDPGSREAYSNFGYSLLGQVIEAVTGMGYQAYLDAEILGPESIEGIELGRTRPENRHPDEVWYQGEETNCAHAFELDPAEEHTCADAGFLVEEFDAAGGHIASTTSMLAYMGSYWLNGLPRDEGDMETPAPGYGSHPDSFALAGHYADDVDVVALFNGRELPPTENYAINELLIAALDEVDTWP